jgi:A/G-specific adenine glycosylase
MTSERRPTGAKRGAKAPPPRLTRGLEQPLPASAARRRVRSLLLAWYRANGRSLPWRETDDPYHILVSEVMLQQTQVDRVLPKYHEWLSKYPTLSSLAEAPDGEVATTWRPLGYNVRPRRLQWIAREAVARFGGELPSDEQTLLSFKGLGRYTVGAIRSFAFRQRAAILDTNVARVLFRVFVADGDPKGHATVRHLWVLSETLVPRKHVFDFNQALMDFGATMCTARKPQCAKCPMRRSCASYPFTPPTISKARRRQGAKN